MDLLILIDDCPRTHRSLRGRYCEETQCLYFQGEPKNVLRACSHPKAEKQYRQEAERRAQVLDALIAQRKEQGRK